MRNFLCLALVLAFVCPCSADELPDKPKRVADAVYWSEVGAMTAAWTVDAITTHQSFRKDPAIIESGYLLAGSRSTAKIMGVWALVDVGAVVSAYEWKRHVHNRYLHPVWHAFMAYRVYGHAQGIYANAIVH